MFRDNTDRKRDRQRPALMIQTHRQQSPSSTHVGTPAAAKQFLERTELLTQSLLLTDPDGNSKIQYCTPSLLKLVNNAPPVK